MKLHNLIQGTPEWLAYRAQHFNASDAPAMMGCSPYKTRAALLRELHTSLTAEVDAGTQRRFAAGHQFEALARPLAEEIVGDELYPCVGSAGKLSASFDGLTLGGETVFEHKSSNAELRAILVGDSPGTALPLHYRAQMEQQLMVSGAERVLFMATAWADDGATCTESAHCWYEPDAELRADILRGWDQFAADLAAYTLPPATEAAPVGKAPDQLPALRIEVTGQVTASNLAEFKKTALAAIRSVNRDLKTDGDFADADKAIKWCADVEARLKAAKEHALSQTASIDALFKTLDDIASESKAVRLDLAKVVDRRKTEVKEQAVAAARRALDQHIAMLNAELAPMRLNPTLVDFAGAIKGLRSIASLQDSLDTALAGAKIDADAKARTIRVNLDAFRCRATGLEMLFSDLSQLVNKGYDDFTALVDARIATHRAAEAAREARRQAEEAARIAAAEQRAREQEAKRIADETAEAERLARQEVIRKADVELRNAQAEIARGNAEIQAAALRRIEAIGDKAISESAALREARLIRGDTVVPANDTGRSAPQRAPEPATLNLGAINARFGGRIKLDAAGLALMGIEHSATDKAAKLYRESDIGRICRALVVLASETMEMAEA